MICKEYLSRQLASLHGVTDFQYHLRFERIKLIHLVFADDLVMFCKGNLSSVVWLLGKFEVFSRTSGLRANSRKSEVYFAGVKQEIKDNILRVSQLREGEVPF